YNYRLDELHAAVGRVQLAKLPLNNERRRCLLETYRDCLQLLSGWIMPFADSIDYSSGHLMVVVGPTPEIRNKAVEALRDARIQSSLHYPCIPDFSSFRDGRTDIVVQTRQFSQRAITLPLFPTMSSDQVINTVDCLRSTCG